MKWLNRLLIFLSLLGLTDAALAQGTFLDSLAGLAVEVRESSGLIYHDGRLITHNDSGDGPYLYEIDTMNGAVVRRVVLANASHVDWEDIAADETYLYIGDIGNNFGNRTDLKIYRIAWDDYMTTSSDTVSADVIRFNYADQYDFSPNQFFTPFDAEAIVSFADSIYLFTKDWSAPHTKVYSMPAVPGDYTISSVDSFLVPALITGVDINPVNQSLLFSSYGPEGSHIITLENYTWPQFSSGDLHAWTNTMNGSFKTEGVCWANERFAYYSTEGNDMGDQSLYQLDTDLLVGLATEETAAEFDIFPIPTRGRLTIRGKEPFVAYLYSDKGQLLLSTQASAVDLSVFPNGVYCLELRTSAGMLSVRRLIVKVE